MTILFMMFILEEYVDMDAASVITGKDANGVYSYYLFNFIVLSTAISPIFICLQQWLPSRAADDDVGLTLELPKKSSNFKFVC